MNVYISTGIAGLLGGGAYALLGICVMLTSRLVAVVNFAQVGVGALGAFAMVVPYDHGFPLVPAVLLGLLAGAAGNALLGWGMTHWFSEGSEDVKTALTIMVYTALVGVGGLLFGTEHPYNFPQPGNTPAFTVANVVVTWPMLAIVMLAIVLAIGAAYILARTRTGLLLRALSARPTTAEMLGINASRMAIVVWTVTGAITTLALLFIAPTVSNDYIDLSGLVVWGLAVALLGGFKSFTGTVIGGLALGLAQGVLTAAPSIDQYGPALPLAVIVLVLLWRQRGARWDTAA
jgi:branched-chain amino acid transport system permease protein